MEYNEDYFAESKMFIIPRYQRSYAWEKKNIVQLLEDVSKEEGYYIGNVIVNTSQNDEKEIIDNADEIKIFGKLYIDLMFDNENTMHEKRDFNITLNKCKYNKKDIKVRINDYDYSQEDNILKLKTCIKLLFKRNKKRN